MLFRHGRAKPSLHGFRPLLDKIDSHLPDAFPEVEEEKRKKVILLLFGPKPDRFIVPPDRINE